MKLQKLLRLTAVITALLTLGAPALAIAAGSISLSANKSTVSSGGSLIVAIYVNAGGAGVNAVQVDLNYPASKLQYVGFSATGGAFEIGAASSGGDGAASIARGTTGVITGSALVGTVTFRALAATGSAAIGVSGSSSLVVDGTAIVYSSSGTSVNFGAVAAAPGQPAAAPAAPAPPKDTAPPTITAVKTKDLSPFGVTITWTTSEPADTAVEYGVDTNYGLSASSASLATAHSAALNSGFLAPQTLLHYRVKSADGAGNPAVSPDQTIQLPGVPVTVIVRGPDGQPQAGVSVTLDGDSGTTDSKGRVTLHSSLGNKKITTNFEGQAVQKPITVTKTAMPLPPYQLDLSRQPFNTWMLTSIGLFVLVLVLLAIDGVLFGSRILGRLAGLHIHRSLVPAATAAAVPVVAAAGSAAAAAQPEPSPAAAALDDSPEKAVTRLMGEPEPAPAQPIRIDDVKPLAPPFKIELQPLAASKPATPGAPKLKFGAAQKIRSKRKKPSKHA